MKRLLVINGPMGVGKTAVSSALKFYVAPCAFLDGDWCWDMEPFCVTDENKEMVLDNICHALNSYLSNKSFENVIFCWVIPEETIFDSLFAKRDLTGVSVNKFTLLCDESSLKERLQGDIESGKRKADVRERSLAYLPRYANMNTIKIDTSHKDVVEICHMICDRLI